MARWGLQDAYDLSSLYLLIEFAEDEEKNKYRELLDNFYFKKTEKILLEKANALPEIKSQNDFYQYNLLKNIIPAELSQEKKLILIDAVNKIIIGRSAEEFKIELFLKDIIAELPFNLIKDNFLNEGTAIDKRINILSKLSLNWQLDLLKRYSEKHSYENTFTLIESFIRNQNSLYYYFSLSDKIFDTDFWRDKKHGQLAKSFCDYATEHATETEKYKLFLKGLVKNVPQKLALENAQNLGNEECEKIFRNCSGNVNFIFSVLIKKLGTESDYEFHWICDLAKEFLSADLFLKFNEKIKERVNAEKYFDLWIEGRVKIEPTENPSERILNHFNISYLYHMTHKSNLENILRNGLLSHTQARTGLNQVDIANNQVNSRREKREPIHNRSIHEYVPLYFNPKNPMLYVQNAQGEIVILAIDKNILLHRNSIFTDGNAASNSTRFFSSVKQLKELNWACIKGEYWNDFDDGRRIRCAEVLAYPRVETSAIKKIYTNNSSIRNFAQEKTRSYNHISVEENNNLYFSNNFGHSYTFNSSDDLPF